MDSRDEEIKMLEVRPWGQFLVIQESNDHKIKRLHVQPGQRLSYQRHKYRSEHWFVLRGKATVIVDDIAHILYEQQSIDIPVGLWHRIENNGKEELVVLEIQTGTYFGEDDIERLEDDYGR